MILIPVGIDWVGINRNFLYKALIYYVDLLIRKIKGEDITLLNTMRQYLLDRKDEIIFPSDHTGDISLNIIAGLLHERGTFRNIGFDPRYEIIWKNKDIQIALGELEEIKKQYLLLIKKKVKGKYTTETPKEILMELKIKETSLNLENNNGLKILIFLKRKMNIYQRKLKKNKNGEEYE